MPVLPAGILYSGIAAGGFHSLAQRVSPNGLSAATLSGSGSGLTNLDASNITQGVLPVAQVPGLDASKIISGVLSATIVPGLDTSKIVSGTLPNARTTATSAATAGTLVARDASGGFAAGVITGTLAGNAASASNASALGGQPPAFYTNASNINTGTLADGLLSSNIPRLNANNTFGGDTTFANKIRVNNGVITDGATNAVATADLGLYSQRPGFFLRFVTSGGGFVWYTDGATTPAGGAPRMQLTGAGNLSVTGSLSKGGGSFKIDHPLDPANKYLYHSFVESPDMMNIYNGNVTTDAQGFATITLPEYFEALNQDFRYQLTVVDADNASDEFILVKVTEKVKDNRFSIRASKGNSEVSWQVTGIRHDAWAQQNRIPNAVEKVGAEKGRYLHPTAFGKTQAESIRIPSAHDASN
ncbi:MAG: hypothetical protein NTV94_06530 [Planctomycetota bacterium]|nr:hypothetical protein [Planctomycetota bacterium]